MSAPEDTYFTRLVSLACHDLRTPLATVQGFARTLKRLGGIGDPGDRYLELIDAASAQLAELLETLSLSARIESGRWEPLAQEADTLELARAAAERLGEKATAGGSGETVKTDRGAVTGALHGLAYAALRHGALELVELDVNAREIHIGPVTDAAPVVLGEELRDLGAAVGRSVIEALGGSVELAAERLVVRLP